MSENSLKRAERASSKEEPSPTTVSTSILSNPSAHKALQLIILAAIYSPISWLSLTPVYGSVPSALYHNQGKIAAALIGFMTRHQLKKILPSSVVEWIPAFAFWIPTIQYVLFEYSSLLGLPFGPIITELLTFYPLTLLSIMAAGTFLDEVDFSSFGNAVSEHGPIIGTYVIYSTVERIAKSVLLRNVGSNIVLSRIGLQLVVAIIYAFTIPGAIIWPIFPSIAFTMVYNVHNPLSRTTKQLNSTLQAHNFTLIDRQESVTGYISVLDNTAAQYRVMRCDHSLLGGEWRLPAQKGRIPPRAQEPIYAIFAMLEAVRLVETDNGRPRRPDAESSALNIGLGVGTAPSALIAHGINTTVVELDPVVYNFAVKYFNLPSNHTPIIGDAVHLVDDAVARNLGTRYDYIIHDVFTGGAEPVELFTQEFLSGLAFLLKEDGVVAIVSDLLLPASSVFLFPVTTRLITKVRTELRRRSLPPRLLSHHPHHLLRLPDLPHLPRSTRCFCREPSL
jgi:hypothetical protein